ncbi:hypothetical protein BDW67DRAFT_162574 [Aspergillus spinulosporus]
MLTQLCTCNRVAVALALAIFIVPLGLGIAPHQSHDGTQLPSILRLYFSSYSSGSQ